MNNSEFRGMFDDINPTTGNLLSSYCHCMTLASFYVFPSIHDIFPNHEAFPYIEFRNVRIVIYHKSLQGTINIKSEGRCQKYCNINVHLSNVSNIIRARQ